MVSVTGALELVYDYEINFTNRATPKHSNTFSQIRNELKTQLTDKIIKKSDWETISGRELQAQLEELERKYSNKGAIEINYDGIFCIFSKDGAQYKLANINEIGNWHDDDYLENRWSVKGRLGFSENC